MSKLTWALLIMMGAAIQTMELSRAARSDEQATATSQKKKRAKHPNWDEWKSDLFYRDAFAEGLIGPRPDRTGPRSTKRVETDQGPAAEPPRANAWSQLISSSSIEDEIKAISRRIEETLKSPGFFKGRGYRVARREFTVSAVLFAIIHEYDGDVRWQKSAAVACADLARAARNAKVGTDPVYREAKQRHSDLQDLIRGSTLPRAATVDLDDWSKICDRGPLMQRLEQAEQERLPVWLASQRDFTSHREKIIREAELAAATAQVLLSEGMPDSDDDEYSDYGKVLRQAAAEMADAARRDDFEAARKSLGEIRRSCSECHDLYRA